jgi:hypothetical protein
MGHTSQHTTRSGIAALRTGACINTTRTRTDVLTGHQHEIEKIGALR